MTQHKTTTPKMTTYRPSKPIKTSSLLSRFTASTAALALVVAGLAALFTVLINSKLVNEAMERTVRGYSTSLARQILASDDPEFWRSIAVDHQVALWVQTAEQERAFNAYGEPTTEDAIRGRIHGYVQVDVPASSFQETLEASTDGGSAEENVVFSWNLRHFARLHDPLVYGHLLLLIPVIGATYMFQRSLLRPLQGLREGVESVATGNFGVQVPVVRMDEIGQVATAFNQMTGQVEQMVADRERLLADVSHELRSPLARIKVALELLPPGDPRDDKRETIQNDVREMESLISMLLEREWLRARADRLVTERVDLVAVVRRVVDTFAEADPGVTFSSAEEPLIVPADAELVRLLVQNLVDNAIKFSLADSRPVDVELETTGDTVRLLVSDDGPGIATEDREEIFKPFVKLDPARGHRSGYGLGLNLCWRIVEAHGGSIEMMPKGSLEQPTRGNLAIVELPRNAEP